MKKHPLQRSLSEQMMHTMRTKMRLPVILLMLACNLTWSLQSQGQVINGDYDGRTLIIGLNGENSTANLRPGMTVSGDGIPLALGAYITQILSGNRIMISLPPGAADTILTNTPLTFGAVEELADNATARTNWTKTTADRAVIFGKTSLAGTVNIRAGSLQIGGVNSNGRNWLHDLVDDNASIVLGNDVDTTLDFTRYQPRTAVGSFTPYSLFERIGSLKTDGAGTGLATVNLTGSSANMALAVGGDNSSGLFRGVIRGGTNSILIKEGTGNMTWQNDTTDSMSGLIRVEAGTLTVTGTQVLNNAARVSLSNNGAKLQLHLDFAQNLDSISGGGLGNGRFSNGAVGALNGNYLNGTNSEINVVRTSSSGLPPTIIWENSVANLVYSFGGNITGDASFLKNGQNTLELFGQNTYTGPTTVQAASTNNTNNLVRLGAFGSSTGVGSSGTPGFGSLPSTTTLQIYADIVGTNRNAAFDLNGATQTLSSITTNGLNTGARSFFLNSGTVTINTIDGNNSGTYDGLFDGFGTINVTKTTGANGWQLTGDSNNTQRGFLNINGGKVTLGRPDGTLGNRVHVTVNGTGILNLTASDEVGSLTGNGTVTTDVGRVLTLTTGPNGGINENAWSGNITGNGGFALASGASIRLTTSQTHQDGTTLNSDSILLLDYGTGETHPALLPTQPRLQLNGGAIQLRGTGGQNINNVVLGTGATSFVSEYNSPLASLKLGTITRNMSGNTGLGAGGGVMQIHGNSVSTSTVALPSGILGGFATHHVQGPNGRAIVSWAVPNGVDNAVTGLQAANYSSTFGSGLNTDVLSNATINGLVGSIRFNNVAPITITADQNLQIETGGILVTPAVGPNNLVIKGINDATLTGGEGASYRVANELIVHQHNNRGTLTLDIPIVDWNGATRLTKTGQGTLILSQINNYTGQTSILGGVLELADASDFATTGNRGTLGNNSGSMPIQNFGYLSFNRTSGSYDINNDINGTGGVRQIGLGETILRGTGSNYTGPTHVQRGILGVASQFALGSATGVTSVGVDGTLQLRSAENIPETIIINGGRLEAVGTSGIAGPLYFTRNSTIHTSGSDSSMFLTGIVNVATGRVLTINADTLGGKTVLTNPNNNIEHIVLGNEATLQVGRQLIDTDSAGNTMSRGFIGRGLVETGVDSRILVGTQETHMVFPTTITGAGGLSLLRNTIYLIADNTYTGSTIIGGSGLLTTSPQIVELRVGADTYTGSMGTGDVSINSLNGNTTASVRYHLAKSVTVENNFFYTPNGTTNAQFLRQGIGSIVLAGVHTAGNHGASSGRSIIQIEGGGKLSLSGTLVTGEQSIMRITNNGTFVFANPNASLSQDVWALLSNNDSATAGTGHWVFRNAGTMTLKSVAHGVANGGNYITKGTVVVDYTGGQPAGAIHDDNDFYLSNGSKLIFNTSEVVGSLMPMYKSEIQINNGATVTINDATVYGGHGAYKGDGTLILGADGGAGWYGLFGDNELTTDSFIGSSSQQTTVRVNALGNKGAVGGLGKGNAINLGVAGGGAETRLEYTGLGETTDKDINLSSGTGAIRISGSGKGALTIAGNIAVTSAGNKTLHLQGQTIGNTITGKITEGTTVLSLSVNSNVANTDMNGHGRWILTNADNDFSGNVTVPLGFLELAGDLGDGSGATSVLGDLTANRTIILGTNNFDGRRFDVFSGGDNLGASSNALFSTGAIVFNDQGTGTATFGTNIKFLQDFNSTTNPGSGELINNGNKVVVFQGTFSAGASGNRNWILDGTNDGENTISGVISDTSTTGANTVGILKEGTGRWRLSGTNTYEGVTQVARGTLEIIGGSTIHDNGVLNLTNAGSDFSAEGGSILRILQSETVGGLMGAIGSTVEVDNGQTLTVRAATQVYSGIITGGGGITRTNNDGTARDMTLTNRSTYTGATTITVSGANAGVTRINAYFLNNGGESSSIGASSSAASNLVLNAGTVSGGLRWQGATDQSTDRLFTIGTGSNGIWADGRNWGDQPKAIHFTNTGAIAFVAPNTTQTLVLRGSTIAENRFDPLITNNGSGATTLNKADGGMWIVTNANTYSGGTTITGGTLAIANGSALGSGGVSIAGGAGTGLQLRNGITLNNNVTNNSSDGGLAAFSGANTLSGNLALAGSNANFRLGVSEGATLNITGAITGSVGTGRFIKYDSGTLILSGTNGYAGSTSLAGGTVVLNYDTAAGGTNSDKLPNNSRLDLGFYEGGSGITTGLGGDDAVVGQSYQKGFSGVTLVLSGGSHNETVGGVQLNNGANRIIREGAGASSTLAMGAITRTMSNGVNNYGTLDFGASDIATTTTTTTNTANILGSTAFATVGQTDWATVDAGGTIKAFTGYANNTFNSGDNTNITNASATASNGATINTLRFDNNLSATTLTLGGVLNLTAGGIMVTKNVTTDITITGTNGSIRRTANTANLDTVIHHFGSGLLNINVPLVNNTNLMALTKTGTGTVILNAVNTYTGRVSIQQGILQVGEGTANSASARLGNGANPISMSDGATLRINVANPNLEYIVGALSGEGLLHLAPGNQSVFTLGSDNNNWVGETWIQGGTLRVQNNDNAMGNLRGMTTVDAGGTLDFRVLNARTYAGRITMKNGSLITVTNNGTPNTSGTTLSGTIIFDNTAAENAVISVSASQQVTLSGLLRASNGFTKTGTGIMTISANQMQEFQDGASAGIDTADKNAALLGQVVVQEGELRLGNARALGGTGVGNETVVMSGASLDLRGQALNWGDDSTLSREIIHISGAGVNGLGALKNSTGNGHVSAIVFDADATLSGGGYAASSRLMIAGYDINPNSSNIAAGTTVVGNYERKQATIDGRNATMTIVGNATSNDVVGTGVTLRDVQFLSALAAINVSEGVLRIDREPGSTSEVLSSANVTNGIFVGYGGATLADHTNANLGLGPNVGARLNFYRNWDTNHSVDITMDGVKAKANLGANYIDNGNDVSIPNPRTYLSGQITLLGDADRNFFHIDGSAIQQTVGEQGNLTGTIQSKLIISGQIVGNGGFTKTGLRELRLLNNNTFTGPVNVLRFGTAAVRWQDNLTNVNGINYQTYGDAEGWEEWGLTLSGLSGRLSGTSAVNLQRRGLITLDNTNRLDQTNLVAGGYNSDRINDSANINFKHGWIKINGGTDISQIQTESLATAAGAKMNLISGSNMIDLMPTSGSKTAMELVIGEINRSSGSVLHISALDSTARFDGNIPLNGNAPNITENNVRVLLNRIGNLQQVGSGTAAGSTNKSVVVGLFGGVMPHEYLKDIRELGYNNGNADYLNQGRNQQFIASSHFMTYDAATRVLRPLDDSEYFVPTDGLLDRLNGSVGQNVNLNDPYTIMRQNMSINALRFGPLTDHNGSGGAINDGTKLTSYVDAHNIQLFVDGTLTINSGMISSAYFTVGNTASLGTIIAGGTLNFGNREAIINNQNAMVRSTDGALATGNLEIKSIIAGRGGLLKTGIAQVVLDGRNTYTGTTTINNGTLFLRSGRSALGASGPGNGVVVDGAGNLNSGNGIRVGSPTAFEDILVKAMQGNLYVMRNDNDLTNWYSNLTFDNVDESGSILHTLLIRADNAATSLFQGNFYGGSSPVSHDVVAMDARIIQFEAAGNNNFIFRGQFGDKADANGKAIPIPDPISGLPSVAGVRTNENEVLRINLNSPSETNFIMEQQYNAVGRLYLSQGNLIITYDPNNANGDGTGFWTDTAISKIPNGLSGGSVALNGNSSQMGFILGNGSSGSPSLFLSRAGQVFNMGSWTSNGSGLKWVGGLNESGTVKYGTTTTTNNTLTVSNSTLRLYSMAGGRVEMDYRIVNNIGTAPDSLGIIKVGRGTLVLQNTTNAAATNSNAELAGGKLILDYDGRNVDRVGTAQSILSGGVLQAISNPSAASIANLATGTDSVLQIRMGNTEVIAEGRGGQAMTINLGNANANSSRATLTRAVGGTLNFVETNTAFITLNVNTFTTVAAANRTISWATVGATPGTALDFARFDSAVSSPGTTNPNNRVKAINRDSSHYQNNVLAWAANMDVSELGGAGFFGTLGSNLTVNTVRFDSAADSIVTIGSGQTLSLAGNGVAGAILVSSNTTNATKSINGGSITTASPEIIIHQYGRGVLNIGSNITGDKALVIAGPSTTSPENFGTSGTVRLTGAKSYTGSTYVTGAVLEISDVLSLGPNPTSMTNGKLTLNGGTLRWTGTVGALGNRGLFLNGDGGVIEVTSANGNFVIGNSLSVAAGTSGGVASQEMFRGDLVKTGAGTITFLGNNAAFQGLLDVRQGSIVVMADNGNANAGTTTVFGTNRSMADGTIMRNGTDMQVFLGNGNNGGDWNIEEYITFEGNNTFTYGALFDVSANIIDTVSSTLYNMGSRRPLNMNGVIDIQGSTTFSVTSNGILRLNNGSGYIKGSGDIVKDGPGRMEFRSNVPDWTGNLVIKEGVVYAANQADVLGTGYTSGKTITLGSADRQGVAELLILASDAQGWEFDINHDINVIYNPIQTKRLGTDGNVNSNLVSYNGNITLNDNLILLMRDTGISAGGDQSMVHFNGSFRDGATTSGNLVIQSDDSDTGANNMTSGRAYGYAVFNGDNSGWTGDVVVSTNIVYNQDNTAILRLGNAKALTAANDVTLNHNSILQAGGNNVTIGNLATLGGEGAYYGVAGSISSNLGSSEIIENASSNAANLTITQSTPSTYEAKWDAYFRDGTLNSQFLAPGANVLQPSAALSITKAGNGWATLTLDNDYSGTTFVHGGVLQVGRGGVGDTGAAPSVVNAMTLMTRVLNGGTLAGTGTIQGKLRIEAGGTLRTGDSAGAEIGTLMVNGDAIFASGANAFMQVRNATYNNPGALAVTDDQYNFWRGTVLTDSFSSALNNLATTAQHDMLAATGSINWAPGTKITLQSDGYTPKAGDIIRLFKGTSLNGSLNVGPYLRTGGESETAGLDLILFALSGNLVWDVSLFNTSGILMVVEAQKNVATDAIAPPTITEQPSANIDLTNDLEPGTSVTLSAKALSDGDPINLRYQWFLNDIPVPGATSAIYTFTANFNSKGAYRIAATNEGGTTLSPSSTAVIVKVNDAPDITFDTKTVNVNPGDSYTFDIAVGGQEPFTYQWYKNGVIIEEATEKTLALSDISEDDQGSYSVMVTNVSGSQTSGEAFLNVRNPITSLTLVTVPASTYVGQRIQFVATFEGEGTMSYVWKRNGDVIENAPNGPIFVLNNAKLTDQGGYTVEVTSPVGTVVSNNVNLVLQKAEPEILTMPVSKTLLSGQPLDLKVSAIGRPELRFVWKQNNRVVVSATGADISKESALVSDGGTYVVEVSNNAGKVNSSAAPAEIVVVDSGSRYLPVLDLGTASFPAVVGVGPKTQVTYQWNRVRYVEVTVPGGGGDDDGDEENPPENEEPPPDETIIEERLERIDPGTDPRITGSNTKLMKISKVTAADEGVYRLEVKGPDGITVAGSDYDLRIFSKAPEFSTANLVFEDGLIGRNYNFLVPIDREDKAKTPEKITAKGLPPGLKIDPLSGLITGVPTTSKEGGYTVTITLANKFGKVSKTGTLTVNDLSGSILGNWVGLVNRQPNLGSGMGGRVDLAVTAKATFSGKVLLAGATHSFKGQLNMNGASPTGTVVIKRTGKPQPPALRLDFTLNPTNNTITSGTLNDGTSTVNFTGWRHIFSKTAPATDYTGYYTMAVGLDADSPLIVEEGTPNVPQGSGFATFTVAADGKLRMIGRLPDGEAISQSIFVGPTGQLGIYQYLYKSIKPVGGSILGRLNITAVEDTSTTLPPNSNNTLGGALSWVRSMGTKPTDRTFKAGFGIPFAPVSQPLEIVAVGGRYNPPADGKVVLDLPSVDKPTENSVEVEFYYGGDLNREYVAPAFPTKTYRTMHPDWDFAIAKGSRISVLKENQKANVTRTMVRVNPKTGLITGSFTGLDLNPRFPMRPHYVRRAVKFQGVLIQENVPGGKESVGVGYFLLPQMPSVEAQTTERTSPIFSGRFDFKPIDD